MTPATLASIFSETGLSDDQLRQIGNALNEITLKKGDHLLRQGDAVLFTHYVHSGCLRSYVIDDAGKDHTLQFAVRDWWISDYTAFFSGGLAMMNIECIQDTTLFRLSRKTMVGLYQKFPELETFFRKKLEKRIAAYQKRTLGNLALTARERSLAVIDHYPNIEQQVKNYHIASYLGMTAESLSRVRKELAK